MVPHFNNLVRLGGEWAKVLRVNHLLKPKKHQGGKKHPQKWKIGGTWYCHHKGEKLKAGENPLNSRTQGKKRGRGT